MYSNFSLQEPKEEQQHQQQSKEQEQINYSDNAALLSVFLPGNSLRGPLDGEEQKLEQQNHHQELQKSSSADDDSVVAGSENDQQIVNSPPNQFIFRATEHILPQLQFQQQQQHQQQYQTPYPQQVHQSSSSSLATNGGSNNDHVPRGDTFNGFSSSNSANNGQNLNPLPNSVPRQVTQSSSSSLAGGEQQQQSVPLSYQPDPNYNKIIPVMGFTLEDPSERDAYYLAAKRQEEEEKLKLVQKQEIVQGGGSGGGNKRDTVYANFVQPQQLPQEYQQQNTYFQQEPVFPSLFPSPSPTTSPYQNTPIPAQSFNDFLNFNSQLISSQINAGTGGAFGQLSIQRGNLEFEDHYGFGSRQPTVQEQQQQQTQEVQGGGGVAEENFYNNQHLNNLRFNYASEDAINQQLNSAINGQVEGVEGVGQAETRAGNVEVGGGEAGGYEVETRPSIFKGYSSYAVPLSSVGRLETDSRQVN